MYNVIIWGTGNFYNRFYNVLKFQELKGAVKVLAVISNDKDIKTKIDGYSFIPKEEAVLLEFDYCLVAVDDLQGIFIEADSLGIPREKLIPMRVLSIPYFDFEQYISIKESKLTIFSRDCWGGNSYHYLGLEFLSPTINMFFDPSEFNKFLANLDYYLNQPVEFVEMCYENNLKRNYPIGLIGDIRLYFNHYVDFKCAKECWERRKKRINRDNMLVVSNTMSEDDALAFDKLPYKNKLIFVPHDINMVDTDSLCRIYFQDLHDGIDLGMVTNQTANGNRSMLNMFKLLSHEPDFLRAK